MLDSFVDSSMSTMKVLGDWEEKLERSRALLSQLLQDLKDSVQVVPDEGTLFGFMAKASDVYHTFQEYLSFLTTQTLSPLVAEVLINQVTPEVDRVQKVCRGFALLSNK